MQIKEFADFVGVSVRTLHYYDEIGLLRPSRTTDAGYRYYRQEEAAILQQILYYRERGFELETIRKIIYDTNFDMLKAMEEHLRELEKQKAVTESLIQNVKRTIQHMKGEDEMSDKEKFEAFRKKMICDNENTYGTEAREKYGDDQVNESNRKMLNMTEEQWAKWEALDEEILRRLETSVNAGIQANSKEAGEIAALHKEWLMFSVPKYSSEMHRGIASMYVCDERFMRYYDKNVQGCAKLLHEAVKYWI